MKKSKLLRNLTAFVVTLSMALQVGIGNLQPVAAAENGKTPSQAYVEKMGKGWNLYNTYDAAGSNPSEVSNETVWGEPVVTKDQIIAVKTKGFKSIRIPMTASTRYSLVNGHYVMDSAWLAKYKQTVDWAVEEGLYVMINLHHDNGWLAAWNGNKSAEEYKRFVDLWTQLADYFKDEPNQVCFETINEPYFDNDEKVNGKITISKQDKMNMINKAGYDVIRKSGGNNGTRMIVIPVYSTASDKCAPTYDFITSLKDPNIITTVHNYSDWLFSINCGIESFDELQGKQDDGSDHTARIGVENCYNDIYNAFTSKGIGVVIGEYGLLGDNSGPTANQLGEKLKFYELMNSLATQKGICLMLWAGVVDRYKFGLTDYEGDPSIGETVLAAIKGQRSSYSTGFNENYLLKPDAVKIPLTLNGNKFIGIDGLTNGKEYTYDEATATVTLSKDFVSSKFYSLVPGKYGQIANLVMKFNNGADWHQFLIKYAAAVLKPDTGAATSGITIPVDFNGAKLRRATVTDESGKSVAPWSWWKYVPLGRSLTFDNIRSITLGADFFNSDQMKNFNGKATVHFEFYDGQVINYVLTKNGTDVTGKSEVDVFNVTFDSKGGAFVDGTSLYKDSLIAKPADPTKAGYTFNGWYSDSNCTTKLDFATAKVTADTTLYGGWTKNADTGTSSKLLKIGSTVVKYVLYLMGIMLIVAGSLLIYKKRRANK